jgi:hypothetical protein
MKKYIQGFLNKIILRKYGIVFFLFGFRGGGGESRLGVFFEFPTAFCTFLFFIFFDFLGEVLAGCLTRLRPWLPMKISDNISNLQVSPMDTWTPGQPQKYSTKKNSNLFQNHNNASKKSFFSKKYYKSFPSNIKISLLGNCSTLWSTSC